MILACDTSCYTTSVALMSSDGRLLAEHRRLLPVPPGQSGLRQSDALFAHVKALPALVEQALAGVDRRGVRAVAVSTRPRPCEGSYMPVFVAGENMARMLSLAWDCPFWPFSHQEGHIAAALWSLALEWHEPFLAAHLSGGTTELLLVRPFEAGFEVEIVGQSDLPAGQFVDRVGVALGLPFPAGPHLERLALDAVPPVEQPAIQLAPPPALPRLKSAVRGCDISFSGPESAAQRLLAQGVDGALLARAVFANIGQSLSKAMSAAAKQYGVRRLLLMGGVAANILVKEQMMATIHGLDLRFAAPAYTGDNAVGIAALAAARLARETKA